MVAIQRHGHAACAVTMRTLALNVIGKGRSYNEVAVANPAEIFEDRGDLLVDDDDGFHGSSACHHARELRHPMVTVLRILLPRCAPSARLW